jgi:hypothetical protein
MERFDFVRSVLITAQVDPAVSSVVEFCFFEFIGVA